MLLLLLVPVPVLVLLLALALVLVLKVGSVHLVVHFSRDERRLELEQGECRCEASAPRASWKRKRGDGAHTRRRSVIEHTNVDAAAAVVVVALSERR